MHADDLACGMEKTDGRNCRDAFVCQTLTYKLSDKHTASDVLVRNAQEAALVSSSSCFRTTLDSLEIQR